MMMSSVMSNFLMSNTVIAAETVPGRRCDWCGDRPRRLLILPGDDNVRHRCSYRCRRDDAPAPDPNPPAPSFDSRDGWYDRRRGYWRNAVPKYCNWCGGPFHQWIRVWGDSSVGYDMPHCGRCLVPWGDEFAFADLDHVHFHEYHYSTDWARDCEDYFEDPNPILQRLEDGTMTAEGLYCMEAGYCEHRFLSVAGFVARYGVMGRSWLFQRQFNDLDWSIDNPYADAHVWDFREHRALSKVA